MKKTVEGYIRKNQGLVNTDVNALKAAKAKKEYGKKIVSFEKRLEIIESKIDDIIQVIERLKTDG